MNEPRGLNSLCAGINRHDVENERVLQECRVDLIHGQRLDLRFQLLVVQHGPSKLFVGSDQPHQRSFLGPPHLPRILASLLRLGHFRRSETTGQSLLELIPGSWLRPVRRIGCSP
jgi:hypothetical protein